MTGELFLATPFETDLIKYGEPALLLASLAILIIFFAISRKKILREVLSIPKNAIAVAILLIFLSTLLRVLFVPLTNRIYFDEDIYLDTGKNIAESFQACMCNAANSTGCYDCILNKAPSAHPFLIAAYSLPFGARGAHFLNSLFSPTISLFLFFICATFLFKSEKAGILSIVLASTVPVFLEWSMTAAAEPTIVLFSLATLFFLLLYARTGDGIFLFPFAGALSILVQTKAESVLFIPIFLFGLFTISGLKKTLSNWRHLAAALAVLAVLISVSAHHIYLAGKGSDWGAEGKRRFSIESFKENFPVNAKFLLFGYEKLSHPFFLTVLFFAGLVSAIFLAGKRAEGAILLLWFLSFFLLYCFFYAGSVRYGADVRYALSYYPAMILLASLAARSISWKGVAILSVAIIISFAYFSGAQVTTPAPLIGEAIAARSYKTFASTLESNCTIVSHVTTLHTVNGFSAVQPWYLENPGLFEKVKAESECILFDSGFWCSVPPFNQDQCPRILSSIVDSEAEYSDPLSSYAFYRVKQD